MARLSETQVFTAVTSVVALLASGTIAMEVAHGHYPAWAAGWGFGLGLVPLWGVVALLREARSAHREQVSPIHRVSG